MAAPNISEFGSQQENTWLQPPQTLHHAAADNICHSWKTKDYVKHQVFHRSRPKSPAEPYLPLNSKPGTRPQHRPKYAAWASEGPMQAIFLDSGKRSGGTGVFLPGTNFQSTKKPACSPVLLPSRVVQALNLNVHALGLQISPRKENKNNLRSENGDCCKISVQNKNGGKDVNTKCCIDVSHNHPISSPEVFLPKEWTY